MPGLDSIEGEGLAEDEKLVYIAGPYTKGSWGANVSRAVRVAQVVHDHGHAPFIPHTMTALWSLIYPENDWIKFDLKWVEQCDALIKIEGESAGADTEAEFAKENGVEVYKTLGDFLKGEVYDDGEYHEGK